MTGWKRPALAEPNSIELGGVLGKAYASGLARIDRDPFTVPFLLADVNFGMERWFTNYSGDISGRFLELASLASNPGKPQPAALAQVMKQIAQYQKADGHFGANVDWNEPIDFKVGTDQTKIMPILWGNGRLLLGLTAAARRFDDPRLLAAARKLGDFYATTALKRFCDPSRMEEYRKPGDYAGNYVTCYFEGMEGLVQLYRITREDRYLQTALKMADFHEAFDTLPVDHSHGSLSQHEALLMLYEETAKAKYLQRVEDRWNKAVKEGFINPSGGVLEKFWITGFNRDEGCSEADWLRLNLMLWRNTGDTRYLDMAERLLWCEYLANQWPSGGYGHRLIGCDDAGPFAFQQPHQESLWCCSFHGPLALREFKSYLAVSAANQGICHLFPVAYKAAVHVDSAAWTVESLVRESKNEKTLTNELTLMGPSGTSVPFSIRIPEWAGSIQIYANGKPVESRKGNSWLLVPALKSGSRLEAVYGIRPFLENRHLQRIVLPQQLPATLEKVVLRQGPFVLVNARSGDIQNITLKVGADGMIQMPSQNCPAVRWVDLQNASEPHAFLFNIRLEPAQ